MKKPRSKTKLIEEKSTIEYEPIIETKYQKLMYKLVKKHSRDTDYRSKNNMTQIIITSMCLLVSTISAVIYMNYWIILGALIISFLSCVFFYIEQNSLVKFKSETKRYRYKIWTPIYYVDGSLVSIQIIYILGATISIPALMCYKIYQYFI